MRFISKDLRKKGLNFTYLLILKFTFNKCLVNCKREISFKSWHNLQKCKVACLSQSRYTRVHARPRPNDQSLYNLWCSTSLIYSQVNRSSWFHFKTANRVAGSQQHQPTMAASSLQMTRREDGSYLFDFVNHSQQVLFTLNECRQFANLCDCSVVVEGQVFYAHKGVLVSCSDYFKVGWSLCENKSIYDNVNLTCITSKKVLPTFKESGPWHSAHCVLSSFGSLVWNIGFPTKLYPTVRMDVMSWRINTFAPAFQRAFL